MDEVFMELFGIATLECNATLNISVFHTACATPESTPFRKRESSEKPLPTSDGALGAVGVRHRHCVGCAAIPLQGTRFWNMHGSCMEAAQKPTALHSTFYTYGGTCVVSPCTPSGEVPHHRTPTYSYPLLYRIPSPPSSDIPPALLADSPSLRPKSSPHWPHDPSPRPGRKHLSRAFVSLLGTTINMRNCPPLDRAVGHCQSRSHYRQLCLLKSSWLGFDPDLDSLASSTTTRCYMETSSIIIPAPSRSTATKARSPFTLVCTSTLPPIPTSPIWLPPRPQDPSPPDPRGKGPG